MRFIALLDGALLFKQENVPNLVEHVRRGDRIHFDVLVTPGDHELRSLFYYRGNGGENGYLRGYKFEIRSVRKFSGTEGRELVVIPYEANPGAPLEERPALRYEEHELQNGK
jgi:hypothetical protein